MPRPSLICEPDPRAAELYAEAVGDSGFAARVDSAANARRALADACPQLAVVRLAGDDDSLALMRALRSHAVPTVAVVTPTVATSLRGRYDPDALVLAPASTDALRFAIALVLRSTAPRTVDYEPLSRATLLGEADPHATARALATAFGVDRCLVAAQRRVAISDGGVAADVPHNAGRELKRRAMVAACANAPLVWCEPANPDGTTPPPDVYCGALLAEADDTPLGLICLITSAAAVPDAQQRSLLRVVGRRLARELIARATHERLVLDLEAARSAGGVDPTTGVWSRAALVRLLDMARANSQRSGEPLAIAVGDVRRMAQLNDRYGHDAGDHVLAYIAERATLTVRGYDIIGRWEADEFVFAFPGATATQARAILERLGDDLARSPVSIGGQQETVGIAFAVTAALPTDSSPADLLRRTAAALAHARAQPGPTVVVAEGAVDADEALAARYTESASETRTLGGNYMLLHEISRGGVGVVYRAEDLGLRRPVAVKVLRPDLAQDERLLDMFRDEAAILASLRHPDVVQVFAFGVDDGSVYFVMELVEGESVEDAITRCQRQGARLPVAKVRAVVGKVGSALGALHQAGLLHRDVKPANILLDPFRDRAVLVDVGIARRRGATTSPAGTAGYMAPEVIVDYEGHSPATDVYGLAVTMYEMLTLELPWPRHDDPMAMIRVQRELEPTRASSRYPELAPVDAVLERGFHLDPRERFQTPTAFALELTQALLEIESAQPRATGRAPLDESRAVRPVAEAANLLGLVDNDEDGPRTRGIVLRQLIRVLGTRGAADWRSMLSATDAPLAEAIGAKTRPLDWVPTDYLVRLLATEGPGDLRGEELGNQLGRSAVRATFRRFFPASAATLSPTTTLAALPVIWSRYHTWGQVEVSMAGARSASIRITGSPPGRGICAWVQGMLHQLVVLSRSTDVEVVHTRCEKSDADACVYQARWSYEPGALSA